MGDFGVCATCGGELRLVSLSNMLTCGEPACEPMFLIRPPRAGVRRCAQEVPRDRG